MKKVNIFISYSNKDSRYFDEVHESLQTVEKEFGLNLWSDQKIPDGSKWKKEIDKALKKTDVGIFLVSRAFLNSKFIDLVELPKLLAQHKKNKTHIIVVVLESCTWDSRSQINKFQVFNRSTPLWGSSKAKRLEALKNLAENVVKTAHIVRKKKNETKTGAAPADENDILPFTNQMSLINFLSPPKSDSENMIMYAAITAPAGQGKSRLIKELKKIYLKKGWDCGYIKLDFNANAKILVNDLPVNVNITKNSIHNNKNLGKDFYDKYSRKKRGQRKPLAIFIDTSDNVTKKDVLSLEKNFIGDLDQYVLTDKFLSRPGKYRLILAGRNLSGDLRDTHSFESFHDLKILPFRYENVYDMIVAMNKVFGDLNEETKAGFAADILYLSGGHPGMMAKIIERYKKDKRHHPVFIDFYIENHWGADLKDVMTEISRGIFSDNTKIEEFAEATVALRYFNRNMLRKIFKGQVIENIVSEIINVSGLYSESNDKEYATLFSDGIIRNLHALHKLANQPDVLKAKCREAQNLCWDEIKFQSIKIEEFIVEYLFQCLQESVADSKSIHKKRHIIRRKFDRKVDEFIRNLAKLDRAKKLGGDLGRALVGALKVQANPEDADRNKALFRFWVIYIYKEKLYTLGVYRDFVTKTEKLVGKHFGRRTA